MISRKYFKVVLLGDVTTGKTCLAKRYFTNVFNDKERPTMGGAFASKIFTIDGKEYQMGVWDTSGEERFRSMSRLYYRGAVAAIICYDVSQRKTFKQMSYWMNELRKHEPDCRVYICATKRDLLETHEANPPISRAESYAKENLAKFFLTSSITGQNVDELFNDILEDYINKWQDSPESSTSIRLPTAKKRKSIQQKKCCSNR